MAKKKRGWAQAMEEEFNAAVGEAPEGWHMIQEIAAEMGLTAPGARYRVLKLMELGMAEAKMFRFEGRSRRFYRLIG